MDCIEGGSYTTDDSLVPQEVIGQIYDREHEAEWNIVPESVREDPRWAELSAARKYVCKWMFANSGRVQYEIDNIYRELGFKERMLVIGLLKPTGIKVEEMWKFPIMAIMATPDDKFDSMLDFVGHIIDDTREARKVRQPDS